MNKYGEVLTNEKTRSLFFQACEAVAHSFEALKAREKYDSYIFINTFFKEVEKLSSDKKEQSEIVKIGQAIFEDFYDISFVPAPKDKPLH